MRRVIVLTLSLVASAWLATPGTAQQFTGTFVVQNEVGGVMRVALREAGNGTVTGTLSSNGVTFSIEGRIEDETLTGTMRNAEGTLFLEAERWENELWLMLYGVDAQGQPDYDDFTEIDLFEEGTVPVGGAEPTAPQVGANPLTAGTPPASPGNPLGGAGTDPYVGTFTDGNVTLQLQGGGGQYRGQVAVGGQVYSVTASGGPNGLEGLIQAPDGQYTMAVQALNGMLTVVSGGQQYQLRPQATTAGLAGQPTQPGAQPQMPGQTGPAGGGRTGTGRELAPGFTEDHPQVREWIQFLAGNKLTRMSSYSSGSAGGYSARTDLYLCSNHSYAMRDESSVSVDVGGAFGNSGGVEGGQGRWYVITNGQVVGLILEANTGETQEFRLDHQNGETYANGERVYVTPAEVCM